MYASFLAAGYVPFRQARKPLLGAIALTSLLLIPLGWRFAQLAEQARLESGLRKALVNKTVTFQRLELVDLKGNWLTDPPHIRLVVYAKEAVTPKQVDLIEEFLARELGKKFTLVFIVNYVEEIQGDSAATGESKFNQ